MRGGAWVAILVVLVAIFAGAGDARAAGDPKTRWYTIVTPHFRVNYHSGIERPAQHVASVAESVYDEMVAHVGFAPSEIVEIVLSDFAEGANGAAGALPYDAIHLIITAPEDMSPLGDVDDWYVELVSHEFTHILHTDNIHGIPALVNKILGKTLAPNQVQPRWILEGLGVYHESARTSGGRLRNSMWDMFMRADVLEDNVASIDQISATVRRWPQGNLYYLYGSYFTQYIAQTYGEKALRDAARDYGGQLIPWGFNRSMRRATGKTYVEMYPEWIASMKEHYDAQADEVRKKGVREGTRITHAGQLARYPRWIPKGAWPEHQGGLLYYRDDGHDRGGFYALDVTRDERGAIVQSDKKHEEHVEHVARTNHEAIASFTPDGGMVISSQDVLDNLYLYGVLERMKPAAKSPFGIDGARTRITSPALRADAPDVSPDGRRVVFTSNHAGTRSIHIGDLGAEGVTGVERLVDSADLEQAFTPRWSPDGTHIAYSIWKQGGYRDIRLVDVRDRTYREITTDRAVDGAPSFSRDGKVLFFHSDRTGISNVYAWELESEKLFQVTNTINGAYHPELSPDGKTLAYVGYTHDGFDLFAMPIARDTWTPAEPYVDVHAEPPKITDRVWPVRPYSAWATLLPRRYGVQFTQGAFGNAVITTVTATDIAGLHSLAATQTIELEKPELQGVLSYSYGALPFDFGVNLSRSIAPRGGYQLGGYKPIVVQESTAFATSLTFGRQREFDTSSFYILHSVGRVGADLPIPLDKLDPYETPAFPQRGLQSSLHLSYSYSNADRFIWSVGPERGISFTTSVDVTSPTLGSDFDGFAWDTDLTGYLLMPWLKHHSVALHAGGGTSGGTFPGRGAFFVGSYVDLPIVDTVRNQLIQGGLVLRGYEPVAESGRSYVLTNAEYRFPIWNIDRGPETLPFFVNRITGTFFFDYGSAFDVASDARFKTGAGAELWFDSTLGYLLPFTFRLGYARGFASGGIDKVYFVAAVPY